MDELKMTGNSLKGSRPLLSFDATFNEEPHYQLMKEMFIQIFNTPKGHPKSKPFFDHVLTFTIADDKVWFRNYQVRAAAYLLLLLPGPLLISFLSCADH